MTKQQELEIQNLIENIKVNRMRQWVMPISLLATVILGSIGVGIAITTLAFTLVGAGNP